MRPRKASTRSPTLKQRGSHKPQTEQLVRICRDLSLADRSRSTFQHRNIASLARRTGLLLPIFEDLHCRTALPHSALLCVTEILAVLRRFQMLLHTCSARMSRMRLALQFDAVSDQFHELTRDLASLLDILALSEVELSEDVRDWLHLARIQCRRSEQTVIDRTEEGLRSEILRMINDIEREIVPESSTIESLFEKLGLADPQTCKGEISKLESEIRDGSGGPWTAAMISLLGVVRYVKCVLFGGSTPRLYGGDEAGAVPADFRCPISLELMRDPVVVSSGQTYDRESIEKWIGSGHTTCPKTGQALAHLRLVPNLALKNLIQQWCRDENVSFEVADTSQSASKNDGVCWNKAAIEAAKMTAVFLVEKLSNSPQSPEESNRIVHELRQLAKTGAENRAFIAEAGAIPLLLSLLASEDPSLQVNSVTALLNLSILEENKKLIVKSPGALAGIINVLCAGATWQAKENAAATLLSLSSLHPVYRKKIGRQSRVVEGLAELVRDGPTSSKRDGLIVMLNLASVRDNVERLVEGGVVEAAVIAAADEEVVEMAVAVLAAVARRGGAAAVAATDGFVWRMVQVFRWGTEAAKEAAAAALVDACKAGGAKPVEELAMTRGVEWLLWRLMSSESMRTRRKAASLGKMCRKWLVSQQLEPSELNDDVEVIGSPELS